MSDENFMFDSKKTHDNAVVAQSLIELIFLLTAWTLTKYTKYIRALYYHNIVMHLFEDT